MWLVILAPFVPRLLGHLDEQVLPLRMSPSIGGTNVSCGKRAGRIPISSGRTGSSAGSVSNSSCG